LKNAIIAAIGISLLFGAIFLVGCDEKPPTAPDLPPVMTCVISGDVNLNYSSKKGFIGKTAGFPNIKQFFFSSYANVNDKTYDVLISIFYQSGIDSGGTYAIYPQEDTSETSKYAWAAFVIDGKDINKTEFWADSGTVRIDTLIVSSYMNFIKGTFNFEATDSSGSRAVIADSGKFNIKKYY